jgi:hypothetical protein
VTPQFEQILLSYAEDSNRTRKFWYDMIGLSSGMDAVAIQSIRIFHNWHAFWMAAIDDNIQHDAKLPIAL